MVYESKRSERYYKSKLGIAEVIAVEATKAYHIALKEKIEQEIEQAKELMILARNIFGELALVKCNKIKEKLNERNGNRNRSGTNQRQVLREDEYF